MLPGQEEAEAAAAAAEQAKAEENEPISAEVVKQRAERKLLYQEARRYARRHGGNSEGGAGGAATAGGSGGGGGITDEEEPDGSSPSFDAHFGVHSRPGQAARRVDRRASSRVLSALAAHRRRYRAVRRGRRPHPHQDDGSVVYRLLAAVRARVFRADARVDAARRLAAGARRAGHYRSVRARGR